MSLYSGRGREWRMWWGEGAQSPLIRQETLETTPILGTFLLKQYPTLVNAPPPPPFSKQNFWIRHRGRAVKQRQNFAGKLLLSKSIQSRQGSANIALKHVIWRFQICNYFHEMFKFRDFMNTLRNFAKSVFACIFAKFKYLAKQFI